MNVACIDFETANSSPCSACSVGIAVFDGEGDILTRYEQFLLPHKYYRYFDPFNTVIHGIRADIHKYRHHSLTDKCIRRRCKSKGR